MALTASKDVVFSPVEGEMVILNLAEGNYYGLDEVGAKIFTRLNEGLTAEQTAESLESEFEVDNQTARSAVNRMIGELTAKGLLVEK